MVVVAGSDLGVDAGCVRCKPACKRIPIHGMQPRLAPVICSVIERYLAVPDVRFNQLRTYPGLYLNSNAYYGIAINDCVRNSREMRITMM